MALSELTKDMAIIQKLDDEPNDVGGLTAQELKAKFDEAGEAIKAFLNDSLLPELSADNAAESLGATLNGETMSIQSALDLLQLASVQAGNVPLGGEAGDALLKKSDESLDVEWRPLFTGITFAAADWTAEEDETEENAAAEEDGAEEEDGGETGEEEAETAGGGWDCGGYTLTFTSEQHKRRGEDFTCLLRHRVDGMLRSNTWAALGTQSAYDPATGTVTLRSLEPYDGMVLFCGGQTADA